MTAHDPSLSRRSGRGILNWLRLGVGPDEPETDLPGADSQADNTREFDPASLQRVARRQQMGEITEFLIAHNLEISAFTLTVAHDFLTGADSGLVRHIDLQIHQRLPITLEWLEQVCCEAGSDQREELNRLMNRLEHNIDEFGQTSTAAQSAASDYNSALAAKVREMGDTSQVLGELITLARAMLESTRSLESEMSRSVLQTRALRRSLDQARRSADEDHVTGLPNRRAFEAHYAREYQSAQAAGDPLCVAFCDIDNFKRINDAHGHEAGDRVLKAVAATLAHISNDRCHVARHGGEEFVVLLRGRTLGEAWELLDETRASLAERRLINRANDQPFGKITFSGGIADVFSFTSSRAALRAADRALFRAKVEGRNRIFLAERETSLPDGDAAG